MIFPDNLSVHLDLVNFFNVPNPIKHKMVKLGKTSYFYPDNISLGVNEILPIGACYWSALKGYGIVKSEPMDPIEKEKSSINLFPNQEKVVESCKNSRAGIVEFKTGSGKTLIAMALSEIWGGKTLILAHSMQNVKYFKDQFKKFLGIEVGAFYGKEKILKDITITTFSSATRYRNMFFESGFRNLIVDEADIFFTKERRNFVTLFPCQRKFGFTGTVRTPPDEYMSTDGVPSLLRFWGKHIVGVPEIDKDPLKGVYYRNRRTNYFDDYGLPILPHKEWQLYREKMDLDEDRKKEQLEYVLENYEVGDHCVVLFDRVKDSDEFYEKLKSRGMENVYKMNGKMKRKERFENDEMFLENGGIIFASSQICGRGWDCPPANKIFLFTLNKDENSIRQSIGRVLRFSHNKESYVYLFADSSLVHQFKSKLKVISKFYPLCFSKSN